MCLAVPGKLVKRYEANGLLLGRIDFGGVVREVCLEYLPELAIGDYALVHVGFAISRVDEESARQTLTELTQLGLLEEADE
jgi:hydrogenase expression/formation protein HypC